MAAAAGFWNHHAAAGAALSGTTSALSGSAGGATAAGSTAGTSGTGGTSGTSDSSTISANDFLTLLVTEMKNQDPTADQDPNEYINQLVQVNSLEQLIDINQTLTAGLSGTSQGTGSGTGDVTGSPAAGATPGVAGLTAQNTLSQIQGVARAKANALAGAPQAESGAAGSNPAATFAARLRHAPGNLAVPETNSAANHVAHALDGRSRKQSTGARLPGGQ